jgi:SAM-dependent methyltransferase
MTRLQLFLTKKWASLKHRNLRREDTWFYSHFVTAANEIGDHLSRFVRLNQSRVLDFGCGDGFTALGLSRFEMREIVGVDLNEAFRFLPEIADRYLGKSSLPGNLSFQRVDDGNPLPFEDDSFNAAYAWSVMEHVQDVDGVLLELYRILAPDGILFIQIEPLYHSPFGSHLQRLIPEPWGHLTMSEDDFLESAWNAPDQVPKDERDLAYQKNEFMDFKKFLVTEYQNLNRITTGELSSAAQNSGFNVITNEKRQGHPYRPPTELLERYPAEDLLTNDVRLTLRKPG